MTVSKEAWTRFIALGNEDREEQLVQQYLARFPQMRKVFGPGKIERVISSQSGSEHASLRILNGKTVITLSPQFWDLGTDEQWGIFSHEIGHWVLNSYGPLAFVQTASKLGLDVWGANPSTMDMPFQVYNWDEAFAETFAVLATKDQRGIGLLRQHWPIWAQAVADSSGGLVAWNGGAEKNAMDWEAVLTKYAVMAFNTLRVDGGNPAHLSESVAFAVGKQAKRLGVTEVEIVRWLQSAYGSVWVRQSDLNPGMDLKEVRDAIFRAYR